MKRRPLFRYSVLENNEKGEELEDEGGVDLGKLGLICLARKRRGLQQARDSKEAWPCAHHIIKSAEHVSPHVILRDLCHVGTVLRWICSCDVGHKSHSFVLDKRIPNTSLLTGCHGV